MTGSSRMGPTADRPRAVADRQRAWWGGRMGRALVVGDSLTSGRPGVEFTSPLQRACGCRTVARGRGGDTLAGVADRLPRLLDRLRPDVVVIEVGVNDLLLPWFVQRGGPWRRMAERLTDRGSTPTPDPEQFGELYRGLLESTRRSARTIACTLTCLGEDLGSDLNARRSQHSAAIMAAAAATDSPVADLGRAFDTALESVAEPSSYLLDDHSRLFREAMTTAAGADALSRRRGLRLTVDGVHLNRRGAATVAAAIGPVLRSMAGDTGEAPAAGRQSILGA